MTKPDEWHLATQKAWDTFVSAFTVHPRAFFHLTDTSSLLEGCGFTHGFTTEHPVSKERVEKTNDVLSLGRVLMRRPRLTREHGSPHTNKDEKE